MYLRASRSDVAVIDDKHTTRAGAGAEAVDEQVRWPSLRARCMAPTPYVANYEPARRIVIVRSGENDDTFRHIVTLRLGSHKLRNTLVGPMISDCYCC